MKDVRPFFYGRPVMYVDVGAYKGTVFSSVAEIEWGAFLEAHLFEPNPEAFPALQQTGSAHEQSKRAKQVHCHNLALGSTKGSRQFRSEGTRTRILNDGGEYDPLNDKEYFEAKISTLDVVASDWGIKHISILKIDVEGHEGEVLEGAHALLENQAVDILYVEAGFDPENQQLYYYRKLEDALRPLGYRLFKVYEQKNEWLTDSPFLRRVNLAFMSETFATQTPFRLSRKLFDLQRKYSQLEYALQSAETSSEERSAVCGRLEKQISAMEKEYEAALGRARQEIAMLEVRISEREGDLARKDVEFTHARAAAKASEESLRLRVAELEIKNADLEKNIAQRKSEKSGMRAELETAKETVRLQAADFESKAAEFEMNLAEKIAENAEDRLALEAAAETNRLQMIEFGSKVAEYERILAENELRDKNYRSEMEAAKEADKEAARKMVAALGVEISEQKKIIEEKDNEIVALQKKISDGANQIRKIAGELKTSRKKVEKLSKDKLRSDVARRDEENRLKSVVRDYKKQLASLQRGQGIEAAELRAKTVALEGQAQAVKETISFQLGGAILDAFRSPAKALALPSALWKLHKNAENRLSSKALRDEILARGPRYKLMSELLEKSGLAALQGHLASCDLPVATRAVVFFSLAKDHATANPSLAIEAATEAQKLDPKPYRAKWLAFRLAENGRIEEAATLLLGAAGECPLSKSEENRKALILKANEGATKSTPGKPELSKRKKRAKKSEKKDVGGAINRDLEAVSKNAEKIWQGYSATILGSLAEIGGNASLQNEVRATAAGALAKWHFVENDPSAALSNIAAQNSLIPPTKQSIVIETQCLVQLGKLQEATEKLNFGEKKFGKRNCFTLLRANIARIRESAEGRAVSSSETQLDLWNSIFTKNSLLPISKKNPDAPLSFFNVTASPANLGKNTGPKVSVLMPVYNAEETLLIAVESLLIQTWENLEVIIVDDCSTDSTPSLIDAIVAKDSRFKSFRNADNQGAYRSRNTAFQKSTGDYIVVHDSDDWWHPQLIEIQMDVFVKRPQVKAVMSHWLRVDEELLAVGTWRPNGRLYSLNYSSLIFSRSLMEKNLGLWQEVRVSGDAEFKDRIERTFGKDSVVKLSPQLPLALALARKASLTRTQATGVRTMHYGLRWHYSDFYGFIHRYHKSATPDLPFKEAKYRIPIPSISHGSNGELKYDIVFLSDFSLKGGAFHSTYHYIRAAIADGRRVGLIHWRKCDLDQKAMNDKIYSLALESPIDILTPFDRVKTDFLIVCYPPILANIPSPAPQVEARNVVVVVNQFASRLTDGTDVQYDPLILRENLRAQFGTEGVWAPISGWVKKLMEEDKRYPAPHESIWHPLIDVDSLASLVPVWRGDRRPVPVIGRHGRDSYTKWPGEKADIMGAYCANTAIEVRILGGAKYAVNVLGFSPRNWVVQPFDSVPVSDFLSELDFFVHFPLNGYIEEFGRAVLEALSHGIPAVLPPVFRVTFGDAAIYCEPKEVESVVLGLWRSKEDYLKQVSRGLEFLQRHSSYGEFDTRLRAVENRADTLAVAQ